MSKMYMPWDEDESVEQSVLDESGGFDFNPSVDVSKDESPERFADISEQSTSQSSSKSATQSVMDQAAIKKEPVIDLTNQQMKKDILNNTDDSPILISDSEDEIHTIPETLIGHDSPLISLDTSSFDSLPGKIITIQIFLSW